MNSWAAASSLVTGRVMRLVTPTPTLRYSISPCLTIGRFFVLQYHLRLLAAALIMSSALFAAETVAKKQFDLPAADAEEALRRFSAQSDLPVMFPSEIAAHVRTNVVKGEFLPNEALDRMLAGTLLYAVQDQKTGALTILRAKSPKPLPGGDPPVATSQNTTPPANGSEMKTHKNRKFISWMAALFVASSSASMPAQELTPASQDATKSSLTPKNVSTADDELIVLSPFEVNSSKDRGYKATNSTAGTRLNTKIKDIPLNLEVITSEFIRDTGATDLRQALRYSAGVVLDSQSDAFVDPDSDRLSAGANDPHGATRAAGDSTFKLRGFVIDQVLRDGLRRQYSADSINIARVEVLRGPSALLYGVGSFGGVINYVPKRPEQKEAYEVGVSMGSHGFFRSEFDFTGPMGNSSWKPAYRITGSYQESGDYTEWYNSKHFTVSPVFSFRPLPNTEITIDNEFGRTTDTGVGFQNIRSTFNAAATRTAGWLTDITDGGPNHRTFRWSGPDTYLKGPFRNSVISITQKIVENLYAKFDAGESRTVFDSRQVQAQTSEVPFAIDNPVNYRSDAHFTPVAGGATYNIRDALTQANASGTFQGLTPAQIYQARTPGSFRGDTLYGEVAWAQVQNGVPGDVSAPVKTADDMALQYQWLDTNKTEVRDQLHGDITYKLDLGKAGKHNFVVGFQYMRTNTNEDDIGPAYSTATHPVAAIDQYSYKNPGDYSPFVYGVQGDGRPDAKPRLLDNIKTLNWDLGYYGVYQGQFFNDRLTLIGGARWDRNDTRQATNHIYDTDTPSTIATRASVNAPTATSPQLGLSFAITRDITVFGLYSTGVVPNYTARDGNNAPFAPTKAKNYEAGIKIDMFNGKLSGTMSVFKIERTNTPKYLWWAPNPYKSKQNGYNASLPSTTDWQYFNPDALWYAIQKTSVAAAKHVLPSGWWDEIDQIASVKPSATNPNVPDPVAFGALSCTGPGPNYSKWWDYSLDANGKPVSAMRESADNQAAGTKTDNTYFPLLDMSDPVDVAFIQAAKIEWTGWGGNFNNTAGQTFYYADGTAGVANAPSGEGAYVGLNDEAKGFDIQLIYSPTSELQIVGAFAHTKRQITSKTYDFVAAPYWPLADWYAMDGNFGTLSYTTRPSEVYTNVQDTTTYHAQIPEYAQSADDTPPNTASLFVHYSLDKLIPMLKGVSLGGGGYWEDKREWFTGFSGGQVIRSYDAAQQPTLVTLYTKTRTTINAFAEYRMKLNEKVNARFALNVDNLLDDQSRYGEIFAPGVSYKFSATFEF
jgi:outer membrane receptor protein involved in Fe transport